MSIPPRESPRDALPAGPLARREHASWLVVTPARNERDRLPGLAESLAAQTAQLIALWIIVDDGSDDDTASCIDATTLPFPAEVISRTNTGGLRGASEREAFEAGVITGLERIPDADRILKIDSDLVLESNFMEHLHSAPATVGLTGGVIVEPGVPSQPHHIRGGLRSYSRDGWNVAERIPIALGWDVLDVVAIRAAGLGVLLVPAASAATRRRTGSSEGAWQGWVRAGVVARWTGYHPIYFALRLARFSVRPPIFRGAAITFWAYLNAGPGPFSATLKRANRRAQLGRLRALARSPRAWLRANVRP